MKRFVSPKSFFGDLDAEAAATLIAAAADVTLVLDASGTIRDCAVRSDELAQDFGNPAAWLGRPLTETVAADSRPKVAMLLRDAATSPHARWRHINHLNPQGRSVPILYCCLQLDEKGCLVAFGRDLRDLSDLQRRLVAAQQSTERDYISLREGETRYRLLFQLSSEAVLIMDAARLRVVEANPAARALLGVEVGDLAGLGVAQIFSRDSAASVERHLAAVRDSAQRDDTPACIEPRDGKGPRDVLVRASFFRQGAETLFLVRVVPTQAPAAAAARLDAKGKLLSAVESAPDGFVVTDETGQIIIANAAFSGMLKLEPGDSLIGRALENWIGASGVDIAVLMAKLRQGGSVQFFVSTLQTEDGSSMLVEISAVAFGHGGHRPCFGFAIRNIERRQPVGTQVAPPSRSVEQLAELIGQVKLKDLVREATSVIERLCIETALDLTRNNRASAAEMLGLSRQSLYVKLRRYGLGEATVDEPAEVE